MRDSRRGFFSWLLAGLVAVLAIFPVVPVFAVSFGTDVSGSCNITSGTTCTIPLTTTKNNDIFFIELQDSSASANPSTPTDNLGSHLTYTPILGGDPTRGPIWQAVWTSSGSVTFTCHADVLSRCTIIAIAGADTLNTIETSCAGSGSTINCALTTSHANDFFISFYLCNSNALGTCATGPTPETGFSSSQFGTAGTSCNSANQCATTGLATSNKTATVSGLATGWSSSCVASTSCQMKTIAVMRGLTQPIKVTMDNSGTPACTTTLTENWGSGSTTVASDGSVHNVIVADSVTTSTTITLTEPADLTFTRCRWSGGGTTTTFTSSTTEKDLTNYAEMSVVWGAKPDPLSGSSWDATFKIVPTGTVANTGSSAICTITTANTDKQDNCQGWSDYNRLVSYNTTLADGSDQRWSSNGQTFSPTVGSSTAAWAEAYFRQINGTVSFVPVSPATWSGSPTIKATCPQLGVKSVCATVSPANGSGTKKAAFWLDYNNFLDCEDSNLAGSGHWISNVTESSVQTSAGWKVACGYTFEPQITTTTTTTSTTSTQTQNGEQPNFTWLIIIPIVLMVGFMLRRKF